MARGFKKPLFHGTITCMAIEIQDVEHLAGLARIAISDSEKELLRHDLEEILAYVSQIKEVESGKLKVESGEQGELYNVMREDINPHESGMFTEDILRQAPSRKGDRIAVKKIL